MAEENVKIVNYLRITMVLLVIVFVVSLANLMQNLSITSPAGKAEDVLETGVSTPGEACKRVNNMYLGDILERAKQRKLCLETSGCNWDESSRCFYEFDPTAEET